MQIQVSTRLLGALVMTHSDDQVSRKEWLGVFLHVRAANHWLAFGDLLLTVFYTSVLYRSPFCFASCLFSFLICFSFLLSLPPSLPSFPSLAPLSSLPGARSATCNRPTPSRYCADTRRQSKSEQGSHRRWVAIRLNHPPTPHLRSVGARSRRLFVVSFLHKRCENVFGVLSNHSHHRLHNSLFAAFFLRVWLLCFFFCWW